LFHELFSLAKQRRLPVTIHAGEAAGPANIYESVVHLGASRIGHGVRVREDREVLELLKARQIPLEMCPVSNIQTKAIPEWALYPLPEYLNEGLLVTVNTDNRTVSGTTLLHEYRMLMVHCGVTENQIADIILNGLRAAFVEEDVKERLVQQFNTARSELGFM
jgi:adenosine deaminase